MLIRNASEDEVIEAIRSGDRAPAKRGRQAYRKDFRYDALWGGRRYAVKQILAVIADGSGSLVVVTVYAFYF